MDNGHLETKLATVPFDVSQVSLFVVGEPELLRPSRIAIEFPMSKRTAWYRESLSRVSYWGVPMLRQQ